MANKGRKQSQNQIKEQPKLQVVKEVIVQPGYNSRHWLFLGVICLFGLIAYSNSFDCGFHFDDKPNILNNDHLKNFSFDDPFYNWSNSRVMGYLSIALNYHYNELDIWGYHFLNLLIHLLNASVVFWLGLLFLSDGMQENVELSKNRYWIAFLAALLFVTHPMASQSVTYIVQRFASLVTLFYLLSILMYVKGRWVEGNGFKRYLFFILAVLFFFLAIHTKENAYTLPLAILLVEIIFFQRNRWKVSFKDYRLYIVLVIIIISIVVGLNKFSLSVFKPIPPSYGNAYTLTSKNYLFTQFNVIPQYIRMMLVPYGQQLDHDFPVSNGITDGLTWLNLLAILILMGLSLFYVNKYRILAFGMLWFFLTLSIESSIVPISDVFFEHRTYLPSFGFLLMVTSAIFILFRSMGRIYPIGLLLCICVLFGYLTHERNKVWKTDLTLTQDNLEKSPNKSRANLNYGVALFDSGNKEEALTYLDKAVALNPEYYDALNNRGNVLSSLGQTEKALADYLKCTILQPDNIDGLSNLGITYAILKRPEEALRAFNRAVELNPNSPQVHLNRGLLFYNSGKMEEAEKDFVATLKLDPGRKEANQYLDLIRSRK